MYTREQIVEIQTYCKENSLSIKEYFRGHPEMSGDSYNYWLKKYRNEDKHSGNTGEFIELSSGRFVPSTMAPVTSKADSNSIQFEIQSLSGLYFRIQGKLTGEQLREIIQSLGHV